MAYNQVKQKGLGRIIANQKIEKIEVVFENYEDFYMNYLCVRRYTSNVNVCEHIFGYFKTKLKQEKDHFIELLQKYAKRKYHLVVYLQF